MVSGIDGSKEVTIGWIIPSSDEDGMEAPPIAGLIPFPFCVGVNVSACAYRTENKKTEIRIIEIEESIVMFVYPTPFFLFQNDLIKDFNPSHANQKFSSILGSSNLLDLSVKVCFFQTSLLTKSKNGVRMEPVLVHR